MTRPEILFPLFASVDTLKGVGPKLAPALEKAAGPIVRDLLFLAPHGLIVRRPATTADAVDGEIQTFRVVVDAHERPGSPRRPWRIRCRDAHGFLFLVFFKHYGDHLARAHPVGAERVVSGKAERDGWQGVELRLVHPDFVVPPERADEVPRLEPVYPASAGVTSRQIRRFALEALGRAPALPEWLEPTWVARHGWPGWRDLC